jgi:hypothetical protein
MPTKVTKMAFEGLLYYGAAGTTAATLLENVTEATIKTTSTKGKTTPRGDGTGPPVTSERVTELTHQLEFTMLLKSDDTSLEALRAAAHLGTPVALRGLDYAAGKGPDLDYTLDVENGQPESGNQTLKFTASPTDEAGRTPTKALLYC